MKKIIPILLSILSCYVSMVNAQSADKAAVSLGVDVVLPFHDEVGGPGVSAKFEVPIAKQLNFTFNAGYLVNYTGTRYYVNMTAYYPGYIPSSQNYDDVYKFVPLKTGLRYFYAKHFYIDAEAGEAISLNDASRNSFIYEGALGSVINFNRHNGLDLSLGVQRYKVTGYDAFGEIAIRIAYRFKW